MEVDVIKCSKIVGGIAAFIVAAGVIWTTSLSAFDNAHSDFVTSSGLSDAFLKQDIRELKKSVRRLKYLQQSEGLTDRQQWELDDAQDELDDLQ